MDIRTSTKIVKAEVRKQLFSIKADELLKEKDEQSPAKFTKKITDLDEIPLTLIFKYVADPNFQSSSQFDNFIESRTNDHYCVREGRGNHRSVAELFRLRKVCNVFAWAIDRMKPYIDYQPIPIVIRIKGIDSKTSVLYKYGLSGNKRPAVSLRRIWHLSEHIRPFETITNIIITGKTISDDLIGSLYEQKSRLKSLKEVYFYDVSGFEMDENTKEENLKKLIELFSTANHVHIDMKQLSIHFENREENVWARDAIRRLRKSNGYDKPSVRKCRYAALACSHGIRRFTNRHHGGTFSEFMSKVEKFKNERCYSTLKQVVYPTARRQQQNEDDKKSHTKKCRRAYRDLQSQVSHLSQAERLVVKQKFTQLVKCFKPGRKVNCLRVKLLMRDLQKLQSIDTNTKKEDETTEGNDEKVFKKKNKMNGCKKRRRNKRKLDAIARNLEDLVI